MQNFKFNSKQKEEPDHQSLVYITKEELVDGEYQKISTLSKPNDVRDQLTSLDFSLSNIIRTENTNLLRDVSLDQSNIEATDHIIDNIPAETVTPNL